jgi:hypothetical protein
MNGTNRGIATTVARPWASSSPGQKKSAHANANINSNNPTRSFPIQCSLREIFTSLSEVSTLKSFGFIVPFLPGPNPDWGNGEKWDA